MRLLGRVKENICRLRCLYLDTVVNMEYPEHRSTRYLLLKPLNCDIDIPRTHSVFKYNSQTEEYVTVTRTVFIVQLMYY